MSDVAAPSTLVVRRRSTLEALTLDASMLIGAGGEARIFSVPGHGGLVAKIYHQPTVERARKVALMIEEPPRIADARAALAWPVDLLLGEGGRLAGFLMPRAAGPRLFELYNPITRRQSGALCDHALLHRAGARLAAAFDALHARGYVVGDVNESNVLLKPDGGVTLVDTDSFQVRDPEDGTVHRSKVGKAEFTPPELQGRSFADFDRAPEHDRFALGVLLFLALMEGTHPFAGRTEVRAETPPVEERIRRGLFPHHGHAEIHPPKLAPPFSVLDPELRALFVRCFANGHRDPSARPSAAEWRAALTAAEARMETCAANPRHRFGPHLDGCPWCERTALLHGRDPFPAMPPPPRLKPAPPRRIAAPAGAAAVRPPAPSASASAQPQTTTRVATAAAVSPAQTPAPAAPASPAQPPTPGGFRFPWEMEKKEAATVTLAMAPVVGMAIFLLLAIGFPPLLLGLLGFLVATIALASRVSVPDPGSPAPRGMASAPAPLAAVPAPASPPALPAPGPVRPPAPAFRLRFDAPVAKGVDAAPVLANRAELEDSLAGVAPPVGMPLKDWRVMVVAWVHEDGTVDAGKVRVLRPTPSGEAFAAAMDAIPRARLRPLLRGGRPVAAWVSFDLAFRQP